jgi:para-aminobenzoate synthetase / 4-amino-4-deoxychorismate lyase
LNRPGYRKGDVSITRRTTRTGYTMLNSPPQCPTVLLESFASAGFPRSFRFDGLKAVVIARTPVEVVPALREVEQAVDQGRHAAGFVSYEAASGLNPDLPAAGSGDMPLIWFGIFNERHECAPGTEPTENGDCNISPPANAIGQAPYRDAIKTIRAAIARGETYQVNFTIRQRFGFSGTPFALYRRMCRNQQAPFCAWIDTGSHRILSASPELFFSLKNGLLAMRPMKGTAPRASFPAADLAERERLAASPKEQAENLMIVDLVRSDLSTIAETGSVAVPSLFDVETYPTVHQMTSMVTARPRPGVGLTDIFRSLFPCGSVTGAPKRRTMEIIRDLEQEPRGVYCGAIGYLSPGQEATFSVAIRTVVLDMAAQTGELGLGSGITWDSEAGAEYRECLTKGDFLHREPPDFHLIETLRYDRDGYMLLERHLRRLAESAAYFGFYHDSDGLRVRLAGLGGKLSGVHKVRVLLAGGGGLTLEAEPLAQPPCASPPGMIAVSKVRVDSSDAFLYHKTTRRERYEEERRRHPDCIDVVFLNERGEVTEGSYNNIVVSLHGELLTPALSCGLLPGLLREELIEAGGIRESILTLADLKDAGTIWLINSVRGWRECNIAPSSD